jgi:hypothetical protein
MYMYINNKAFQPICRQGYYVALLGVNGMEEGESSESVKEKESEPIKKI